MVSLVRWRGVNDEAYKAGTKGEERLEEEDKLGVATKIKIEKKRAEPPPPASKPGRSFKDIAKRMSLQIRQASTALPIQRKRIFLVLNMAKKCQSFKNVCFEPFLQH